MIVASLNDYWKLLKLDLLFAPDAAKEPDMLPISPSEAEIESEDVVDPSTDVPTEATGATEVDAKSEGTALNHRNAIPLRLSIQFNSYHPKFRFSQTNHSCVFHETHHSNSVQL